MTVTNVNEAPTVTSGATASVAENASTSTVVYTATATDPDAGDTKTWSLTGTDASLLNINASGQVRLNASADFEAKSSYSFNVVDTDSGGLSNSKAVVLSITDVNTAPVSPPGRRERSRKTRRLRRWPTMRTRPTTGRTPTR